MDAVDFGVKYLPRFEIVRITNNFHRFLECVIHIHTLDDLSQTLPFPIISRFGG